jgi:hypothetical protein
MEPRNYRNQFHRDYWPPEAMLPALARLTDESWGNDVCPSFRTNDGQFVLWVDAEEPEDREIPGTFRFSATTDEGKTVVFMSDSIDDTIRWIDKFAGDGLTNDNGGR